MNWEYNAIQNEHILYFNQSRLAAIQIKDTKSGNIKVKSIIDVAYYGQKIQEKMEKQKKDWVCYRKKFKSKEDAEKYVDTKKKYIQKFIEAREKEI